MVLTDFLMVTRFHMYVLFVQIIKQVNGFLESLISKEMRVVSWEVTPTSVVNFKNSVSSSGGFSPT